MRSKSSLYLVFAAISVPLLLWTTELIMPTFDDWTTLSSPNPDPHFWLYVLPGGTTWRPFDGMMGYVNYINYQLYPALNHLLVVLAHVGSSILVLLTARRLGIGRTASAIAATFFYISPAMLGTVLSVDGLNQSYCQLFGMLSVYTYLSVKGRLRLPLWLLCVLLSTFSKDNGLAWAVVAPIVAYGFDFIDKNTLRRHISAGLIFAVVYGIVRLSLPNNLQTTGDHIEELESLSSKLSGTAKWLGYTWTATDFLALFHAPSRNLLLVALTLVLSAPFSITLLLGNRSLWRGSRLLCLTAAMIITALPNLLIAMSLMNVYCSLGMAALMVAWLADNTVVRSRVLHTLFILYIVAALITDVHHWLMAWQTSLPGIETARKVVRASGPAQRAYNIILKDDYPKYSSFCVPFDEAYGWGRSVLQVTGYTWPKEMADTTIAEGAATSGEIHSLARKKMKEGYDCVWIVSKNNVEIVRELTK